MSIGLKPNRVEKVETDLDSRPTGCAGFVGFSPRSFLQAGDLSVTAITTG